MASMSPPDSELLARHFLYVVGLLHMALTTRVNVVARPGRVGALGSFAVNADRIGDADAGRADRRRQCRSARPRAWMADRARVCGLVLQADASQRGLRLRPRRQNSGWPYVDPNPLGTLRQSHTAVYRLLPRLVRRPGAKDPDHEYTANTAVDPHHRGRRYAPAGLIEYLDAGGPVVPVAPARQHQRHEARTRAGQQARARGV